MTEKDGVIETVVIVIVTVTAESVIEEIVTGTEIEKTVTENIVTGKSEESRRSVMAIVITSVKVFELKRSAMVTVITSVMETVITSVTAFV